MTPAAHPDVRELAEVEVITKPLDLDFFLEQVRRILAGEALTPPRAPRALPAFGTRAAADTSGHRIELVLYISSASPASIQARRNLERLLTGFETSQIN